MLCHNTTSARAATAILNWSGSIGRPCLVHGCDMCLLSPLVPLDLWSLKLRRAPAVARPHEAAAAVLLAATELALAGIVAMRLGPLSPICLYCEYISLCTYP